MGKRIISRRIVNTNPRQAPTAAKTIPAQSRPKTVRIGILVPNRGSEAGPFLNCRARSGQLADFIRSFFGEQDFSFPIPHFRLARLDLTMS
jgi:hypothetical protein